MAVQGLTEKGDSILVPTPGYHAFYNAVTFNERRLIICPMKRPKIITNWTLIFLKKKY